MLTKNKRDNIEMHEELLTRYQDGELSPEQVAELEELLLCDHGVALQMERSAKAGALLRGHFAEELAQIDFKDFWEGVEAKIDNLPQLHERQGVRGGGSQTRFWVMFKVWYDGLGWRPIVAGAVVAAVAISIGLTSTLIENDNNLVAHNDVFIEDGEVLPVNEDAVANADTESIARPDSEAVITDGVEVSSVSGGEGSTVMVIHSPNQATIIWVDVDDATGGTSI